MYLTKHSRIIAVVSILLISYCYTQAETTAADISQLFIYEKPSASLPKETIDLIDQVNAQFEAAKARKQEQAAAWDDTYDFNIKTNKEFATLSDKLLTQAKALSADKNIVQQIEKSALVAQQTCANNATKGGNLEHLTSSLYVLNGHSRFRASLCPASCNAAFNEQMKAMRDTYDIATEKWNFCSTARHQSYTARTTLADTLKQLCIKLSADAKEIPDKNQCLQAITSSEVVMEKCQHRDVDNFQEPYCPEAINAHIKLLETLSVQPAEAPKQNNPGMWAKLKALVTGQQK